MIVDALALLAVPFQELEKGSFRDQLVRSPNLPMSPVNLGHCLAYALSKARAEPLLYKGEDFAKTDVEAAL